MGFEQKATKDAKRGLAPGMATATASPTLTCGAYEFGPNRLEPAPQLSPNRLVFEVPANRADWCVLNGAPT